MKMTDKENIEEVIEFNDYEGIRDMDGWETLELTVRDSYPMIAELILKELGSGNV